MSPITVPVVTVTLGGTDITAAAVGAPRGGKAIVWQGGANFDGSSEAPGSAVILVDNTDLAFNTDNASSPYFAVNKLNKILRITSVYSATTYYHFHGYVTRIVPRDDKLVEIHASDPLWWYKRLEASVPASFSRTISEFRGLILDDIGVAAGERSLNPVNGPEAMVPFTGADHVSALNVLDELNKATGSFHYIKPTATTYQYTVRDRTYLQSNAVSEAYSTTDMANPFPVVDISDENLDNIINEQRVTAKPRLLDDVPTLEIWGRGHGLHLNAGQVRTVWADWNEPAFFVTSAVARIDTTGTAPLIVVTPFSRSAKIVLTGGTQPARIYGLLLNGTFATVQSLTSMTVEDAASITAYGRHKGSEITSDYISSGANAVGLASGQVRRWGVPRPEPTFQLQDRFPSILLREIGQRVSINLPQFSWATGKDFVIRGLKTEISNGGYIWTTTYQLQQAPTLENLFTIGGTADQGIGGTAILGY